MGLANRSAPPGPIVPVLRYTDVPAAIDWLCSTFGFTERHRAGVDHAQLNVGAGSIMLSRFQTGLRVITDAGDAHESTHYVFVPVDDVIGITSAPAPGA